jgi:hypothetical protein
MSSSSRPYHQQRSLAEIEAAMRSDVSEAVAAHFRLAELHLERCATCDPRATIECQGCLLTHVCYRPLPAPEQVYKSDRASNAAQETPVLRIVSGQMQ